MPLMQPLQKEKLARNWGQTPIVSLGDACSKTRPMQMGPHYLRVAVGWTRIWQRRGWHGARVTIFSGGVEVHSSFTAMGFLWKTHCCTVPALATPANAFGIDQASTRPAAT